MRAEHGTLKHIHGLNQTLEITRNTHRFAVTFSQLFTIFFQSLWIFDKRLVTSTEAHTCFFSLILLFFFFFIGIRYGSLSQFVLRHHTGEREREREQEEGEDTEADRGTEELEAGVLRCSQTPDKRWRQGPGQVTGGL